MATQQQQNIRETLRARLYAEAFKNLDSATLANPSLPEVLSRRIEARLNALAPLNGAVPAADGGLSDLMAFAGAGAATLDETVVSPPVADYDEQIAADRINATADLYYIYMHERLGIWQVMYKLQELFRAGTLRIWNQEGALGLYRFDKHNILRYQQGDRMRAYRRVFGYTNVDPGPNARANPEFHGLFTHFIGETAKFWRDKRISEVIRERATDPTFGSIAIVRRAALDLRNNLKNSSYGYVNVLRNETSQALQEAFDVLTAPDIRAQFGAESPWDVVELVMWQYYHRAVFASTMNRMAVTGRDILKWLSQNYVLTPDRSSFEANVYQIAEAAEEWISSEEGMRLSRPTPPARNVYMPGPPPSGGNRRDPVFARSGGRLPTLGLFD